MVAYGQAKTANVLFAVELDRRWSGDGIRGYSLHPGGVYLQNNDVAPLDAKPVTVDPDIAAGVIELTVGVAPHAADPESAQRLWELSEKLVT
jgi:NAD(P)-dependent dehydrogenase (short-subunit alcohol dehydrogenase family)